MLVDGCKENEMVIANTIVYQSKSKEIHMHGSVQINIHDQIDYVRINRRVRNAVKTK